MGSVFKKPKVQSVDAPAVTQSATGSVQVQTANDVDGSNRAGNIAGLQKARGRKATDTNAGYLSIQNELKKALGE